MGGLSRVDASKERLKWTQELHDLFEKAVNQLGGPDRATPKGILKAMGIPALTIYHVKSHLQKYRIQKFVPESSNRGKFERRNISEILPNFSTTSGAQLNEALQMHKEAIRRMSDHTEVQRNLKAKIESQARYLDRITEDFKNRACISKSTNATSPISLPSLCDESESNAKGFESDGSEIDKSEVRLQQEFRVLKKLRTENIATLPQYKDSTLDSLLYTYPYTNPYQSPFPSFDNNFQWSDNVGQSVYMPSIYNSYN